jgi:hypothetical protein
MEIRFHARASRDQIASRKFFSALLRAPRKKKLRFQQKTLLNCTAFAPHNGTPRTHTTENPANTAQSYH